MKQTKLIIIVLLVLFIFSSCETAPHIDEETTDFASETVSDTEETEEIETDFAVETETESIDTDAVTETVKDILDTKTDAEKLQENTFVSVPEPTVISFPDTNFFRVLTSVTSINKTSNRMIRYNYNYNEIGLLTSVTHDITIPYDFPYNDFYSVYRLTEYELFYENNELIIIESTIGAPERYWNYENGKLIYKHFLNDTARGTYYSYDESGNLINTEEYHLPACGVELELGEKYTYSYDENNRLQRELFEEYGKFKHDISYTYDELGNLTEIQYHDENGNYLYSDFYSYNENGDLLSIDYADENIHYDDVVYTYDDHGKIIKEEYYQNDVKKSMVKHIIKYDSNNNIVKYDDITLTYDEYGYCTKQISSGSDVIYEYTYLTYFIEDTDLKLAKEAETLYSEIIEDPHCFVDVWDKQF